MGKGTFRYEATLAPDGRVQSLVGHPAGGAPRPVPPESPEGVSILATGRDILYRFDEERCLRDLAYPDVLLAMRQEVHLTLQKVRHGELLDEPELVPHPAAAPRGPRGDDGGVPGGVRAPSRGG